MNSAVFKIWTDCHRLGGVVILTCPVRLARFYFFQYMILSGLGCETKFLRTFLRWSSISANYRELDMARTIIKRIALFTSIKSMYPLHDSLSRITIISRTPYTICDEVESYWALNQSEVQFVFIITRQLECWWTRVLDLIHLTIQCNID